MSLPYVHYRRHVIAKPGNKTAIPSWSDPYVNPEQSISGLLMSQRCTEAKHQQPWYWPNCLIFWLQHQNQNSWHGINSKTHPIINSTNVHSSSITFQLTYLNAYVMEISMSCLTFFKIMCTDYTICVFNLKCLCIFSYVVTTTQYFKYHNIFSVTQYEHIKTWLEITIKQCVYSHN